MDSKSASTIYHLERIYQRHERALCNVLSATDAVRLSLRLALEELAEALEPAAEIADERDRLDALIERLERVLEKHDSARYADLVAGKVELPVAIDTLLEVYDRARAGAISTAVDRENELATLIAERNSLRQELATVRSFSIATPHADGNGAGKTRPAGELIAEIAAAPATPADHPQRFNLSQAARDYMDGLHAGRWQWRQVPKAIRLEIDRGYVALTERRTQAEFDAMRPEWMPAANSVTQTLGIPWSQLSDLTHEIEVTP